MNSTTLSGWGRYPALACELQLPRSVAEAAAALRDSRPLALRGLGRSYGDSSLGARVLGTDQLDDFLGFEPATGTLHCAAGVTLDEILRVFVPRGWFLPVTPGTRFVTVAGAVASDVHGKNHHVDGTFGMHVSALRMLLGNGEVVSTSRDAHPELFAATCGGMGLTGMILEVSLRLKPIGASQIVETTIKADNLDDVLSAFEAHAAATYSVAWIDCLARGGRLGRSLLMLGEHAVDGALEVQPARARAVPFDMPAALLNPTTVSAFNTLYHGRVRTRQRVRRVAFEPFFYPLDALLHWNRMYGRNGFLQYQFVLPQAAGRDGLRRVLERISASGLGSFLAVLKVFGAANHHLLSFPTAGYTLALDFKAEPAAFALMDALDALVLEHGGRLYLAKDARMSTAMFRAGYPRWTEFETVRERYHAAGRFSSAQSQRLGLQ